MALSVRRLVTPLDDVMARKFLDVVRSNITSRMPDNADSLIDAADVRENVLDMVDSLTQDEAGLTNVTDNTITLNLTDAWTILNNTNTAPVITYDTPVGGDADFLKVDQAAGTITSSATAGYTYEALGAVTVNSAANEVIEATIGVDGAPGDLIGSNVGSAGSRAESIFLRRYLPSTPANSAFSIMVRAPDGSASNVEITTRSFGVIVLPTNNP